MASVCLVLTVDLNVPSMLCIAIADSVYSQCLCSLLIFVKHVDAKLR
jgi:hypothetical protein